MQFYLHRAQPVFIPLLVFSTLLGERTLVLLPAAEQRWPDVTLPESGTQPVQGLLLGG